MLNIEFNPIQCTSQVFKNLTAQEGFLYFVTDTKQMFLGKDGKFIDMCGGINIVYGKKYIEYVDSGQTPDPNVPFVLDDLEVKEYPLVNDLILNEDGCFYKVKTVSIEDDKIETTRLTLQGTGGGGGGGGGGTGAANLRINHYGGQNRYFSAQSTKAELGIIAYSDDAANYISGVEMSWDDTFAFPFLTISNLSYPMEKPYYVDIGKHLSNISTKGTRVYIRVTDKYGSTRYTYYTVFIASLQLAANVNPLFDVSTDTFDYACTVGGSLDLNSRTVRYELFSEDSVMPIYTEEYELEATQTGRITKTLNLSTVGHGDYTLKVQIIGVVNNVEIYSNELVHKVLRYRESVGTAIFSALIPEKTEQYSTFNISYLLTYGNATKQYAVNIYIDDKLMTTQQVYAGEVNTYPLTFETQGSYLLKITIDELGIIYTATLEIVKYTGSLPVINIDRDDLKLYLSARGKTNNAADKNVWVDSKTPVVLEGELKGQPFQATLNDFYYRNVNGWMVDEDKVDYLKVTQGASVVMPKELFTPYVQTTTKGFTVELDFMIDGIWDYDSNLIECLSYYGDGSIKTGFVVKGDTFRYYASGEELVSLNLVEGKRIKLGFVIEPKGAEEYPMCYTYLDGIISNVFNYLNTYDFNNNSANPAELKISSEGGQINIYNIRMYSTALDEQTMLNNFQATIGSLAERQKSYESNLIRDLYGDIDLEAVEALDYNLQIPYVKITGGYAAGDDFVMVKKNSNSKPALPIGKKDYRAIDIEIIYPTADQNPYFAGYKNFKVTTTYDDPALDVLNGFEATPNEAAIMYAQGTSSLEYPVKNLRVKLKNKKFTVRNDIAPVELVTFKADFMESAGAHNTGAANYVDDVYENIGIMTPGQAHYADKKSEVGTIVTSIKGHPCVIFWNPGVDENGNPLDRSAKNYKYIGKYNFNLDKATPEPFGFMNDDDDEKFGYLQDAEGNLVLDDNGKKINSIYCFEFLDNVEKVCNFLTDPESYYVDYKVTDPKDKVYEINDKTPAERYRSTWYDKRLNEDGDVVPGWCRGFESRYPDEYPKTRPEGKKPIAEHDADALKDFAFWLNALYVKRYGIKKCPHCGVEFTVYAGDTCPVCETPGGVTVVEPKEEEAIQDFRDQYQQYLDPDFTMTYYLITEVLLMADSRVKNMMIATWGKEHRTWKTDSGEERSTFDYVWYPIFYDMDTMLGLDNIGYVIKNYYDEDTTENVYNGDEILWKFVRDALKNELASYYTRIEQSSNKAFTAATIIPYFNDNQATMANETFYNEDAFYKYIDTYRNGYTNHLTGVAVPPGTGERLYAAQGNRAMMREFFINNRVRYLAGKYLSTNYQESDRIEFRLTYPKVATAAPGQELSDENKKINASIAAVPPSGTFNYTSMKTGYAGVKVGTVTANHRFEGEETYPLTVNTSSGSGSETYLYGVSNLADVGDLSNKYLYKLVIGAGENNLKRLILGNHNKDYYNPFWGKETLIDLKGFRFLEEFNLENCGTFTGGVNFTDSPQIKKVLLNGSAVTELILPVGGVLNELRIPDTLTNFAIDSHPTLNNDKFTIGYFDYDANRYVNNFKNLVHISMKGVPNLDTYGILREAILENDYLKLESYCFTDVNWTVDNVNDFEYSDKTGNIIGIKILDTLINSLAPYEGVKTPAEALTGTITINASGKTINEFDIYQTYHFKYPNLKIQYGPDITVESASSIKFYNIENITDATEPYYTVLSNKEKTLQFLTSAEGPAGSALQPPVKVPTATESFTFANSWLDQNGKKYLDVNAPYERKAITATSEINTADRPSDTSKFYLYTLTKADGTVEEYIVDKDGHNVRVYSFELTVPTEDLLHLTPEFTSSTRVYTIQYFSDDKRSLGSFTYTYRQKLSANAEAPIYYNKSNAGLEPNMRWTFLGWINEKDFENDVSNPTFIDEETFEVTYDMKLFARCVEEDCTKIATDWKYFDFAQVNIPQYVKVIHTNPNGYVPNSAATSITDNINIGTKWVIRIKEKYRNHLGGKITIPTYTDSSRQHYVEIIEDLSKMDNITDVFFLDDSKCMGSYPMASGKGFYHDDNLKKIYLPSSFEYIGQGCFTYTGLVDMIFPTDSKLKYIGPRAFAPASSLAITQLPDSVEYIGESAFSGCDNLKLTKLPFNLTQVGVQSFQNCPSLEIREFGHTVGQSEFGALESKLEMICHDAFAGSGITSNISNIRIKDSVKSIGNQAFVRFGTSGTLKVTDDTGILDTYVEIPSGDKTITVWVAAEVFGDGRSVEFDAE